MYARSLGINVNLWWGTALTLFGAVMLWMAWRGEAGMPGRRTRNRRNDDALARVAVSYRVATSCSARPRAG